MIIRNMKKEDKETVIDMMRVFYNSEAVLSNGSEEIFENDVYACMSDNPYIEGFSFVNDSGELLGYAMIAKSFSTEFGKKCIWIEDIYIKPEYRNKGYGKMFFEKLFSMYEDVVFRLEAEEENKKAIRVYEKCGFEVIPYLEFIKKQV